MLRLPSVAPRVRLRIEPNQPQDAAIRVGSDQLLTRKMAVFSRSGEGSAAFLCQAALFHFREKSALDSDTYRESELISLMGSSLTGDRAAGTPAAATKGGDFA